MKLIRNIFIQLFTGANVAIILLMWACCGVTYLSPEVHPRLSLLGLAFPFFLLGDILFIFFWLAFCIKRIWIPLVGLFACCFFVRGYFPLNWPSEAPDSPSLTILTYNTCGFGSKVSKDGKGREIIRDFLLGVQPDIICLQESDKKENFEKNMESEGYESVVTKEFSIYSKLPIIYTDTLALQGHHAHAMRAYLQDGQDTIMLMNLHLRSNKFSVQMKEAYREALEQHESDSIRKGLSPIVRLLTAASPVRAAQADSLTDIIRDWLPRRVVVCGDFNDTPISYAHRVLTKDLKDAFTQSGNGLGFTFHEKGFPVRIDHILYNDDYWESYETQVRSDITCSDHFPILTKLVKKVP